MLDSRAVPPRSRACVSLLVLLVLAACAGPPSPGPAVAAPSARSAAPSSAPPTTSAAPVDPDAARLADEVAALPMLVPLGSIGPAAPATPAAAIAAARAEFELVTSDLADGTSKLYARSDFLPLDDPRGMSTGDFVGRLRAVFGEVEEDDYTFRHRPTGLVVTAYAAQSGPSYGGGNALAPDPGREGRLAKVRALTNPSDRLTRPFPSMTPEEMRSYREEQRAYHRAIADALAGDTGRIIRRLDALLSAVPPVDWRVTRYWGEDPTVYVEGVKDGVPFSHTMDPPEGLAYLIDRAERRGAGLLDASQGAEDADLQLVAYWGYHMELDESASARPRLEPARPRVQRAWFRLVERAHQMDAPTRGYLLSLAELHATPLRLDPAKAAAALRGPARP